MRHRVGHRHRILSRAAALSLAALLGLAGTVAADGVAADGDALTPAIDGTVHLGDVGPGAEVGVDVRFVLTCSGLGHVDPGQSVVVEWSGGSQPADGAIVSVSTATLDPLPTGWTPDGEGCASPAPTREGGALSRVVLRAPSTPADGYAYTIMWTRSLQPAGNDDGGAFGRTPTTVSFTLDVVGDTPPTLVTPADFVVEGDTTGGWTADWSGVTASDAEDDPDPAPTCDPVDGALLSLGTTTVACSVSDSAGSTVTATFDVTVVDTTAPTILGLADREVTTGDPSGATLDYALPTASDIVDAAPAVDCAPASGDHVPVGTTTVTCTARDASGNEMAASFDVDVRHVPATAADAWWLEPVGDGGTFVATRGRALPVKVRLFVGGVERRDGIARLGIRPCAGGAPVTHPLSWAGGRWNVTLDTGRIAEACSTVEASIDGAVAGSFTLELRGSEPARSRTSRR